MLSIGCDPEMFLLDASEGLVSAIDKIGGSKKNPLPLPLGDGFAVQEDNVALEYNIPPAGSKAQLVDHMQRVLTFLNTRVSEIGLHFSRESAVSFPMEQCLDPRAMEFGCDPDFNAWTDGGVNPKPMSEDIFLRSCGGHVHVGYAFNSDKDKIQAVKYMDLFLGVPSTKIDKGQLRRQLYGKPGAFRYQPYGLEYRVLSNFWTFKEDTVGWIWDATTQALDAWQNNKIDVDAEKDAIFSAINNNNAIAAQYLIAKYQLPMVNVQ